MARLSVPANPSLPFQQVVEQAQTTQSGVVMQQSILTSQPVTGTPGPAVQVALRSWYSGDRKLMAVQRYEQAGVSGSYVERTLRDGAQPLGEWRTSERTPTGITSGQVGYVYLDRLDQPIGLLTGDTARVVQYTWRGLAEGTVFIDGTPGDCSIFTTGCLRVVLAAHAVGRRAALERDTVLPAIGRAFRATWRATLARLDFAS